MYICIQLQSVAASRPADQDSPDSLGVNGFMFEQSESHEGDGKGNTGVKAQADSII